MFCWHCSRVSFGHRLVYYVRLGEGALVGVDLSIDYKWPEYRPEFTHVNILVHLLVQLLVRFITSQELRVSESVRECLVNNRLEAFSLC